MVTGYRGYHNGMPRSRNPSGPDVQLEKDGQFGKTWVNLFIIGTVGGTRQRVHWGAWGGVGSFGEVSCDGGCLT
jgi:hypothetical protein